MSIVKPSDACANPLLIWRRNVRWLLLYLLWLLLYRKSSQDVICYIDLCVCVSITRAYAAKSFKFKFPGNIICACVELRRSRFCCKNEENQCSLTDVCMAIVHKLICSYAYILSKFCIVTVHSLMQICMCDDSVPLCIALQMLDGNRTINMAIHNIIIMYITLHCMLLYALATMHPCIHNDA